MTARRVLLAAALLVTAALLQVTVVNGWRLPGGGPDLVLLVVVSLGLCWGPTGGAVTGFAGGLLVDVVPPGAGEVGQWALVLCVCGYLAGLWQSEVRRPPLQLVAVVGVLSVLSVLLFVGVDVLFGEVGIEGSDVTKVTLGTLLYDLLLAPFVVPAVTGLARRAEPDPNRLAL